MHWFDVLALSSPTLLFFAGFLFLWHQLYRLGKSLNRLWEKVVTHPRAEFERTLLEPGMAIVDPVEEGFYRTPARVVELPEEDNTAAMEYVERLHRPKTVVAVGDGKFLHWDHVVRVWELKSVLYTQKLIVRTRMGTYVEVMLKNDNDWEGWVLKPECAATELLSERHELPSDLLEVAQASMV